MSSYRKKRYPQKNQDTEQNWQPDIEFSNPGVEKAIHTGRLTSGLPYQRPVNPREVERLIREWDGRLLEPVVVSFRDGKFYVVDGQHRIAAMRKMNGGNGVMVNCKVYSGLTYEQEAGLCYKLDKAKKRLSMFSLMREAWQGDPRSLTANLLSGMALFVKTYDTEFTDRTFIKRFSQVDPDEIIRRGRADFSTNKASLRFARVILKRYNGQRGGRKLPYRFDG